VVANFVTKVHNVDITDFQITGCPEAIGWFGTPKECCLGFLSSMEEDVFVKIQSFLVAECLSKGAITHVFVVINE
jgi:hypothetical protein